MTAVVGSAPGRVNLIGEHTDYNGGFALPLALPHRTRARVVRRDDDTVTVASTAPGTSPVPFSVPTRPGDVDGWAAYVARVLWAVRDAGHALAGAAAPHPGAGGSPRRRHRHRGVDGAGNLAGLVQRADPAGRRRRLGRLRRRGVLVVARGRPRRAGRRRAHRQRRAPGRGPVVV